MDLNHHDAEEIVQKVLLVSWKKLPEFQYDNSKKFRGWLCDLTFMCVKDFYRAVKRYNNKLKNASLNQQAFNFESNATEIEKIAEAI